MLFCFICGVYPPIILALGIEITHAFGYIAPSTQVSTNIRNFDLYAFSDSTVTFKEMAWIYQFYCYPFPPPHGCYLLFISFFHFNPLHLLHYAAWDRHLYSRYLDQKTAIQYEKIKNKKFFVPTGKKGNSILSLVAKVAAKAKIPIPNLLIEKSDPEMEGGDISVSATGWPPVPTPTIQITEDLFELYENGFTQNSMESILAHEIAHLKNNDLFLGKISNIFNLVGIWHFYILALAMCYTLGTLLPIMSI